MRSIRREVLDARAVVSPGRGLRHEQGPHKD